MSNIFNSSFIRGNEITFYIYIAVLLIIIIFAAIATYKEIKNENK